MYKTCPKCRYELKSHEQDDGGTCPACGIIFSKWLKSQLAAARPVTTAAQSDDIDTAGILSGIGAWIFHVEEETNPFIFWSRVIVFVGLVIWGWTFIQMDFVNNPFEIGRSYMHNINLVFHEAGHIIFMPFGWFMTILGGSLFQVLMPMIVMFVFLIKNKNTFAASVGLWWMGQSLMDVAPYIDDAMEQKLVLLGGHTGADAPGNHDWNNILNEFNVLEKHRDFATVADSGGTLLMLLAFAWGGFVLYKQYQNLS